MVMVEPENVVAVKAGARPRASVFRRRNHSVDLSPKPVPEGQLRHILTH